MEKRNDFQICWKWNLKKAQKCNLFSIINSGMVQKKERKEIEIIIPLVEDLSLVSPPPSEGPWNPFICQKLKRKSFHVYNIFFEPLF